jgi:hypothetical protein
MRIRLNAFFDRFRYGQCAVLSLPRRRGKPGEFSQMPVPPALRADRSGDRVGWYGAWKSERGDDEHAGATNARRTAGLIVRT